MTGHGGIVSSAIEMIFKSKDTEKALQMSCVEVHIETVRDLVNPENEMTSLMTNQSKWHPSELTVHDEACVKMLIEKAQLNRSFAKTELNMQSSRSHCIY